MTILTFSCSRDITSWLIWVIVLLTMLLPSTAFLKAPETEIWQSAYDPVSWLGAGLRVRWYAAWRLVRQWVKVWERWMV